MLYLLDLMGVAFFAISGALAGLERGLDLFGVLVLAAVTAVGGGTTRDLLLNRYPVFWIRTPSYLYVILAAGMATFFAHRYLAGLELPMLIADALGLGLFAISGAQVAESSDRPAIVIILMGTMTGVAGGVIRDMLSGVVPILLRQDIYASAAVAGIVFYLLAQRWGLHRLRAFPIAVIIIVTVRLFAVRYDLQLPGAPH